MFCLEKGGYTFTEPDHSQAHFVTACRTRVQSVDMRKSHLWYPVARALDRKIIYHAGPTNSGKTYNALQVTQCFIM